MANDREGSTQEHDQARMALDMHCLYIISRGLVVEWFICFTVISPWQCCHKSVNKYMYDSIWDTTKNDSSGLFWSHIYLISQTSNYIFINMFIQSTDFRIQYLKYYLLHSNNEHKGGTEAGTGTSIF